MKVRHRLGNPIPYVDTASSYPAWDAIEGLAIDFMTLDVGALEEPTPDTAWVPEATTMETDWGFQDAPLFMGDTSTAALLKGQMNDHYLLKVRAYLQWDGPKYWTHAPATTKRQWDVQRKYYTDTDEGPEVRQGTARIIVAKSEVGLVMDPAHLKPHGGHMGRDETLSRLFPHFVFDHMFTTVATLIKACDRWQRRKSYEPLNAFLELPSGLGWPLAALQIRNQVRLGDYVSLHKMEDCATAARQNHSDDSTENMYKALICEKTLPRILVTDQGKEFTAWDEFLPCVVHAYNCAVHPATGFTPFFFAWLSPDIVDGDDCWERRDAEADSQLGAKPSETGSRSAVEDADKGLELMEITPSELRVLPEEETSPAAKAARKEACDSMNFKEAQALLEV
ncbi:hypothetical protein BDK51DRAFT_45974 [Blyttiomyces helicus]|uniref:Integrase zinc-binding domain-containing protein n=1 Tax=Blyttiomyces helicus TaxID=388810 RepID=A0A4P9W8F4_9FUNG|nr:hypothetical protein BDK51DRAFT_45974 [Blyttiomyces helicus]|eukprot:RKO87080.1 hypothetical protein BDK51DRAFT_45974 [Blyttiomyces helicus]